MFTTKKADAKGRITLGKDYANTMVMIETTPDGNLLIKRAAVVPLNEHNPQDKHYEK